MGDKDLLIKDHGQNKWYISNSQYSQIGMGGVLTLVDLLPVGATVTHIPDDQYDALKTKMRAGETATLLTQTQPQQEVKEGGIDELTERLRARAERGQPLFNGAPDQREGPLYQPTGHSTRGTVKYEVLGEQTPLFTDSSQIPAYVEAQLRAYIGSDGNLRPVQSAKEITTRHGTVPAYMIHTDHTGEDVLHVIVQNKYGIHARPATEIAKLVGNYGARVTGKVVVPQPKEGLGEATNLRSVTGTLTWAAEKGNQLEIRASGPQSKQVIHALRHLFTSGIFDSYDRDEMSKY